MCLQTLTSSRILWESDSGNIELMSLLKEAHNKSAYRSNASTGALINTFHASGSYTNSIAAALMTLGGLHGPIEKTIALLRSAKQSESISRFIDDILAVGGRVWGWGNSFIKGGHDEDWEDVRLYLEDKEPIWMG
jgi:hypothetical protein